jgi:hypothetical protein
MKFTILVPHWKSKITSFAISQFLKFKGKHEIELWLIDNSWPEESGQKIASAFGDQIRNILIDQRKHISSHGVALDHAMRLTDGEWVICAESDSFPTEDKWLDVYENIIKMGYDGAGSLLKLSGGTYKHPCGALYKRSVWKEANDYFTSIPYKYYPNFMMRDNFPVHAMVHNSLVDQVSAAPEDWVELSSEYKGNTKEIMETKEAHYRPVCGAFHSGAGGRQEALKTYGNRTHETDAPFIIVNDKSQKIIGRMGYEPGQALHYYEFSTGRRICYIDTETFWMPNRENQQQERTIMANGFTHLWAGSSYLSMKGTSLNDVYEHKNKIIEELYNSLPINQKIH